MTTPAAITQAEIQRAIAAARAAGLRAVEVTFPGGARVCFPLDDDATPSPTAAEGDNPCDAAFGVRK